MSESINANKEENLIGRHVGDIIDSSKPRDLALEFRAFVNKNQWQEEGIGAYLSSQGIKNEDKITYIKEGLTFEDAELSTLLKMKGLNDEISVDELQSALDTMVNGGDFDQISDKTFNVAIELLNDQLMNNNELGLEQSGLENWANHSEKNGLNAQGSLMPFLNRMNFQKEGIAAYLNDQGIDDEKKVAYIKEGLTFEDAELSTLLKLKGLNDEVSVDELQSALDTMVNGGDFSQISDKTYNVAIELLNDQLKDNKELGLEQDGLENWLNHNEKNGKGLYPKYEVEHEWTDNIMPNILPDLPDLNPHDHDWNPHNHDLFPHGSDLIPNGSDLLPNINPYPGLILSGEEDEIQPFISLEETLGSICKESMDFAEKVTDGLKNLSKKAELTR